ncbi:MAG: DUF1624 domain-containing protein [Spirochaetales bacterium]|nr:MAG: DUF1624 domain-containing protein [Spirochaetales bacterium]
MTAIVPRSPERYHWSRGLRVRERIRSLDMLRGLIMMLMALDHFIYFINRFHPSEFWLMAPPVFPAPAYAVFRLLSHLCAPGFVLLAGTSLVLSADRRMAGDIQARRKVRSSLVIRGVILIIVVQLVLEQGAWGLGDLGGRGIALNPNTYPGAPLWGGPYSYLGVIYALGLSIILGSFLLRLPEWTLAVAAGLSLAASPVVLFLSGSSVATINPFVNALFVPGLSVFFTNYPLFPWFGVFLLGMLLGRRIVKTGRAALGWVWLPGLAALIAGAGVRLIHPWGEWHKFDPDRAGSFFELSKYPPSLAYLGMTLGVLCLVLWALARVEGTRAVRAPGRVLQIFGREPLFFYLLHLYSYAMVSFVLVLPPSPILTVAGWLVSLAVFAPLLSWFHTLKGSGKVPWFLLLSGWSSSGKDSS